MAPKGKLLALVAIFAAVGVVTATGAFTTVSAERTATVNIGGDDAALLGITAAGTIDEGAVTTDGSTGVTSIDLTESGIDDADGINPDATTTLTPLAKISNNGQDNVGVTVSVESVSFAGTASGFDDGDITVVDSSGTDISGIAQDVDSGDNFEFGLILDLESDEVDQNNLSQFDITLSIEADEEDYNNP